MSDWFTIATDVQSENSTYPWTIPENLLTDYYILRIHSPQTTPLVRDRVSNVFKIYQGRSPIGNTIYLPSGAARTTTPTAPATTAFTFAWCCGVHGAALAIIALCLW